MTDRPEIHEIWEIKTFDSNGKLKQKRKILDGKEVDRNDKN